MGLDVSHGCWEGAYSAFMRWRIEIARVAGIDLLAMEGFGGAMSWSNLKPDVLHVLLYHSDCDGSIEVEHLEPLANRLTDLLPLLSGDGGGHIGNYREKTQTFIDGLRLAASLNEPIEFY